MMDRKQIGTDISAHHLGLMRKEVASVIEVCLGHWASLSDANRERSLPEFIDAVMARVAPKMLEACHQAIEVDRLETLFTRWYVECEDGADNWHPYNAQQFARRADAEGLAQMLDGETRLVRVEHSLELD